MSSHIEIFPLEKELSLHEDSNSPLIIRATSLSLIKQNNQIAECHLNFWVTHQLYQRIDRETLFNLKPEIRSPFSAGNFRSPTEIQIEATLDPALLPNLGDNIADAERLASYIEQLSQEQPKHPILSTYSWYALEVKQQQETGETGYRTLWSYLKPSEITTNGVDSEKISEAMLNFSAHWGDISKGDGQSTTNHSEELEDVISQGAEEMIHTFEELTNNLSEMTQEIVSESIKGMNDAFEERTNNISEISHNINSPETIFKAIVNFFVEDNWQFSYLKAEPIIRVTFQGKNGQWECYAKAREEKQQFVFYSIFPTRTPLSKRLPITEFITRANYGMIMGNFEFDFTSGEIRYKTSIDVEGDNLSFALIKQMVHANVMMVDEYFPGIMAVIEGKMRVKEALAQIEG